MKKTILSLSTAALLMLGIATTGCNGSEEGKHQNDHEHNTEADVYQCPMKCEGDKTYDKANECPVCGMDMEKTE